jgi:hypothetical protein
VGQEVPEVSATAVESGSAEGVVLEAPALFRIVWADPQHMAEHLAVWSLSHLGPRAERMVTKLHASHPDAGRDELEQLVVQRQTRIAMTEGAFVGGPFIILIAVAFCAALLAQAEMVYALAGAAGNDPTDEKRAADLLVLLGAYDSTGDAAAALDRMARDHKTYEGRKLPRGTRWDMLKRMCYLLGVLAIGDDRSRLRVWLGWTGIGILFVVGIVLPLVWVPYMAYATRRSTLRLGARARAYYSVEQGGTGVSVQPRHHVSVGGTAAVVRTALLVLLPVVAGVIALLTGAKLVGGHLVSAGLMLLAVSAVATFAWIGWRWWRRRRAEPV